MSRAWKKPGSLSFWLAPVYHQAEIGFRVLVRLARQAGILVRAVEGKLRLSLLNGSRIECRSWEREENLQGPTIDGGIVVDEAGLLTPAARAIISTRRSATLAPIRYIGNPGPSLSEFWNLVQQAGSPENAGTMALLRWTWRERAAVLTGKDREAYERFVQREKENLLPFEYSRLYEGEFAVPEKAIFAPWVDSVSTLPVSEVPHKDHPYLVAWDIGQSNDWTVGVPLCLQCFSVSFLYRTRRESYASIKNMIAEKSRLWNEAAAVVEINGPGAPIFDEVAAVYSKAQAWTTGNVNKRAAILTLNHYGRDGKISLANLPPLQQELKAIESVQNPNSKIWTFGAPSGMHDDAAMALIIAIGAATSGAVGYLNLIRSQIEERKKKEQAA